MRLLDQSRMSLENADASASPEREVSTQHPYSVELWVDLQRDYGSRVLQEKSAECECKAGDSEKSKHVIAVMLYLSRLVAVICLLPGIFLNVITT